MPEYIIQQGDSTASVAYAHGFHWRTVWNDPRNAELRRSRHHPNVLRPGDVLFIPDRQAKEVSAATERRHRFRRKGVPETLRLRLLNEKNEPRSDVPYTLEIDGRLLHGRTDGEGRLEHGLPPDAREGRLLIRPTDGREEEEYPLAIGYLDPKDEMSGIRARLMNMGYLTGDGANGDENAGLERALKRFQRDHGMRPTGEIDDEVRQLLHDAHGS